ncbi:DNA sulfur modification protein DndB [Microbacterium sp. No. 7]|uniref:DNA sulfur modification protein DndB n=1 Tax=Microbacterium sp. No. 7 TaxID=1714373 RepID=UPI0006D190CE|nr:DNA sulfur modification protein DndB [Microbacterium sp. No. 7]ALJ19503.1 hypothetical protein AOA12_06115 [Microbacterium sp. No. 7]
MARPVAEYTTDERFFATRYKQGGRTVYLLALTPAEIVGLVGAPSPNSPSPGNRRVSASRANDFASYYLEQESWVIPGLILRAPNIFTFEQDEAISSGGVNFGVVSYPKREGMNIQILDGQHRILGFHLALDRIQKALEKARDQRSRAARVEGKGSRLEAEAQATIDQQQALLDRFYSERASIEIQVTDSVEQWRQMFFDIANNAKGISVSVKSQFDQRKVVNRALPIILEHPLLDGRVDMENDRLGRSGPNLLSLKHLAEITKTCSVGLWGRVGKVMEATLSEREVATKTTDFIDLIVDCFPLLLDVQAGRMTPDELRRQTILGSVLFLRQLAGLYWEMAIQRDQRDALVDFFIALSQHVGAPVQPNSIWVLHGRPDTFTPYSTGPNHRRQDIKALGEDLLEWALIKPDFVWAPPLPAPVFEVAAEQPEQIDYSDLDDPELEAKLQQEDVDLGISAPRKSAKKS